MSVIRPRFSHFTDLEPVEVQRTLVAGVKDKEGRFEVKNFPGFTCLRIAEQDRHFWSPRLILSIDPEDDGRTQVTGLYGPNANVWAILLYAYLFVGCAGLFGGILGWVQSTLGNTPWGLWIFAGSAVLITGLFLMARIGRKIGEPQISQLHEAYEGAMGPVGEPH